ncbi:unnamed protein product [Diatraea saccharalis]|uniref:Uncharacterized protein n=1 Tax=Diatraea saccharalis TaxID=40085 RepID=A0A9N9QPT4_9NEOP|nr:unnamed protein product [Diatraea saccharalis]
MVYLQYYGDYYVKDFSYISHNALKVNRQNHKDKESVMNIWLKEILAGLKQFFYGGTLHGVKYIFEPTFSSKERVTWIIIVVISVAFCAANIIKLFCKWTSTPFVNVIDSLPTPIWAVPFPTVVLCPHLHVKQSFADVSKLDHLEEFFASLVCPRMLFLNKTLKHRLSPPEIDQLQMFILNGALSCSDIVKSCNWPAAHETRWVTTECCQKYFRPIFTDYGLCYAFNSLPMNGMKNDTLSWQQSFNKLASPAALEWGLDKGYPKVFPPDATMKPLRVMVSGENYGLSVELYLNISEHQHACDGNSLGFTAGELGGRNPALNIASTSGMDLLDALNKLHCFNTEFSFFKFKKSTFVVLIKSPTNHVYTSTVLRLPMDRMTTIEVSPITYKTDAALRSLAPDQRQCFFQNERQLEYYQFYTGSNCKHDVFVKESKRTCNCTLFNWPRKSALEPICSTDVDFECIDYVKGKVEEQQIYAYYAESEEGKSSKEPMSCHPSCNDVIYDSQVFYSDLIKEPGDPSPVWGYPRNLFLGFSIISLAEFVYFVLLRPIHRVAKEAYHRII